MGICRRAFIASAAAAGAGCVLGRNSAVKEGDFVFLSDLHIEGAAPKYAYSKKRLEKTIDEILSWSVKPKGVVCFGDIACSYGLKEDYVEAKRILSRLEKAGIPVHFTMGNHDRRSFFFEQWPECAKRSLVSGKCVSVVDLGTADLVLLDALKGTDDRAFNDMGPVEGGLDETQLKWFEKFVAEAKRPFFVGSHQFVDLYVEGLKPIRRAAKSPYFVGWIYGHDHQFLPSFKVCDWGKEVVKPTLCLPSSGLWGDIGYVIFSPSEKGAVAKLNIQDFYFSTPRPAERRPAYWDERVGDLKGKCAHFVYG